jgi:CheY-like chemotaxis protein/HPt (histidine-containing phosphotransfer) domain-containing protein
MRGPVVVLLIDDQPFIGELVKRLIGSEPSIFLHVCYEPEEAVSRARDLGPDVILLDLMMPSVDGMTLLRRLREDPRTSSARILMLSGTNDTVAQQKATAAGADGFLVKLPPREAFLAAIRGEPDGEAPGAPADQALDRRVLASLRNDTQARSGFVDTLIDQYLGEAAGLLVQMRAAVVNLDAERLRQACHRLRGASQTLGANPLAALSAQMEGHANRTPLRGAVLNVLLDEVDRAFSELKEALAAERSSQG